MSRSPVSKEALSLFPPYFRLGHCVKPLRVAAASHERRACAGAPVACPPHLPPLGGVEACVLRASRDAAAAVHAEGAGRAPPATNGCSLVQMVAAWYKWLQSGTYGCSLVHTVAALNARLQSGAHGCSLEHKRLQHGAHTVAAWNIRLQPGTYGCSLEHTVAGSAAISTARSVLYLLWTY